MTFRELLAGKRAYLAPAVFNPLSAKIAAAAGFEVLYLSAGVLGYAKCSLEANMNLTEQEAAAFWPVYESYQKEWDGMNGRIKDTVKRYADAYNAGAVADDTAKKLLDEALAIEAAELDLKKSYLPKFGKVLPAAKVARYYQIENKIRSAVRADLASGIPLVQ